jgi:hypothetical protein
LLNVGQLSKSLAKIIWNKYKHNDGVILIRNPNWWPYIRKVCPLSTDVNSTIAAMYPKFLWIYLAYSSVG